MTSPHQSHMLGTPPLATSFSTPENIIKSMVKSMVNIDIRVIISDGFPKLKSKISQDEVRIGFELGIIVSANATSAFIQKKSAIW